MKLNNTNSPKTALIQKKKFDMEKKESVKLENLKSKLYL